MAAVKIGKWAGDWRLDEMQKARSEMTTTAQRLAADASPGAIADSGNEEIQQESLFRTSNDVNNTGVFSFTSTCREQEFYFVNLPAAANWNFVLKINAMSAVRCVVGC